MISHETLQRGKEMLQVGADKLAQISAIAAFVVASRQGNIPLSQQNIFDAISPVTAITLDIAQSAVASIPPLPEITNPFIPKNVEAAELLLPGDIVPTIFTSADVNTPGATVETYTITLAQWPTLKTQLSRDDIIAQHQTTYPNYMADNTMSLITIVADIDYTNLQINGTPVEQIILNTEKNERALQVTAGILPNATGTNATAGLQLRRVVRLTGGGAVTSFSEYDQPDAQTNSSSVYSLPKTNDGQLNVADGYMVINGVHLPNGQTGYVVNLTKQTKDSLLEKHNPNHTNSTIGQFDIDPLLTGIANALKFGVDMSTNPNLIGLTTTGANSIDPLSVAIELNKGGEAHITEAVYGAEKYVANDRLSKVSFRIRHGGTLFNTPGNPTIASVDYYPAVSTGSGETAKKISATALTEHNYTNVPVDNLYPVDPLIKLATMYVKITDTNSVVYWGIVHYGVDIEKPFLTPPTTQAGSVPDSISLEIEVVTGNETLSGTFWSRNPTVLQWRAQSTATPVRTPTPTVTSTATSSPIITITPTPSITRTPTTSATASRTITATVTGTPTSSATVSPTWTGTSTSTSTPSSSATPSQTNSPTASESPTGTITPSVTPSPSPSPSPSDTSVPTSTPETATVEPGTPIPSATNIVITPISITATETPAPTQPTDLSQHIRLPWAIIQGRDDGSNTNQSDKQKSGGW